MGQAATSQSPEQPYFRKTCQTADLAATGQLSNRILSLTLPDFIATEKVAFVCGPLRDIIASRSRLSIHWSQTPLAIEGEGQEVGHLVRRSAGPRPGTAGLNRMCGSLDWTSRTLLQEVHIASMSEGLNPPPTALMPIARRVRRGQGPPPRSGAPKAQGLMMTQFARDTIAKPSDRDLIGHYPTNRVPICT